MKNKFVHLHVHTEYSLLDGLSNIGKLTRHVKENNMDSVAISDHGVMYGAIEFYKKANKEGIKPIIGMEAYTTNVDHKERPERGKFKNFHLLLLAKNRQGYKNLMKLTSIAHLEGYYYRPRVDRDTLAKHADGLICTSACPQGEIAQALAGDLFKEAKSIANWFLEVFGEDYYLEVQRHEYKKYVDDVEQSDIKRELIKMIDYEKKINKGVVKLSRELGIPLVATNDAHYIEKKDANAQDALVCIATGKNVSDTKRLRFIDTPTFYLRSPGEMAGLFDDLPDAIENTIKISEKCNVEIPLGQWYFPEVKLPNKISPETYLKRLVASELKKKFKRITKEIKKRVELELDIICSKGYAAYFLIFEDMARWAKERGIPINTRGSVAGSIVSYALNITIVNPISYGLPFERFLNPYRPSAPDIDLDIADDRREEMLSYLVEKYGKDRVAQICTFGRMLARGAVRDVARVLGYPYAVGDRIAKVIPPGSQGFPMTVDRALNESPELMAMYGEDTDVKKVVDLARQIEGSARHVSVHAAGVIISPSELNNFTPLQLEPKGKKVITQYEMWSCEDVGLVKLDVLGIRNLSILRGAIKLVKAIKGKDIDLTKLPLDDKKTYDMLTRGETMGTFQLSGSGMTRYIMELAPERIEDIMAMIALYRPGPMANIPEYIARKKGEKPVKYYHPKMESFLDKSFGILVYQEDLLFTALELAGYTWKTVDALRKAVGKKIPSEMAKQHKIFVEGCKKHSGMTQKQAEGLWELFEPFQGYGFNKAHAASYGLVAYQTAYMKANYPVEFMCSLLTAESSNTDKVAQAVSECRRIGIKVLPPDINNSDVGFKIVDKTESLEGKAIRFGLGAIKNVGNAAIEAILNEREKEEFVSYADFLSRVDNRKVNKRVLESLVKVGALSSFGKRAALLTTMEETRRRVAKPKGNENQQGLFSTDEIKKSMQTKPDDNAKDIEEFNEDELQGLERALLGFSLSAKPVEEVVGSLVHLASHRISEISHENNLNNMVKLAVVVSEVKVVVTKTSGREMAFVRVNDGSGSIDLVVFPKTYQGTRSVWIDNKPLLITGRVDSREDSASIIVESIFTKEDLKEKGERLYIRIPHNVESSDLKKLKNLLISSPGPQRVSLIFEGRNNLNVDSGIKISWTDTLARRISEILNVN